MIQWKTKSFRHFSFQLPYVEESFFFFVLHNLMLSIISCVTVDWRDSQMDHKYYLVTWCQVHWLNHIHIDVCACLMLVCLCLCVFVCCFFRANFSRLCMRTCAQWLVVCGMWLFQKRVKSLKLRVCMCVKQSNACKREKRQRVFKFIYRLFLARCEIILRCVCKPIKLDLSMKI